MTIYTVTCRVEVGRWGAYTPTFMVDADSADEARSLALSDLQVMFRGTQYEITHSETKSLS